MMSKLIQCPHCPKLILARSPFCPYCGGKGVPGGRIDVWHLFLVLWQWIISGAFAAIAGVLDIFLLIFSLFRKQWLRFASVITALLVLGLMSAWLWEQSHQQPVTQSTEKTQPPQDAETLPQQVTQQPEETKKVIQEDQPPTTPPQPNQQPQSQRKVKTPPQQATQPEVKEVPKEEQRPSTTPPQPKRKPRLNLEQGGQVSTEPAQTKKQKPHLNLEQGGQLPTEPAQTKKQKPRLNLEEGGQER